MLWLEAGATWLNADKPRPFALASTFVSGLPATLVYGSTQETEKRSGAAAVGVDAVREGVSRNGLRVRTYFYPGTLLLAAYEGLPPHAGYLGTSLTALRNALRTALGIGQGSCLDSGSPPGSLRGRIVSLAPEGARLLDTPFAIVLTEPRYSARRKYQVIVPLVRAAEADAHEPQLCISFQPWMAVFPEQVDRIMIPVSLTVSVWHEDDIAHETEYVLDDDSLAEIDRRLCGYFSLPPADAGDDGGR